MVLLVYGVCDAVWLPAVLLIYRGILIYRAIKFNDINLYFDIKSVSDIQSTPILAVWKQERFKNS